MQSEDRVIHFSVELIHPPAPVDKQALKKLYFELSDSRHGAYDNTEFTNPGQARFYSRRGKRTQSMLLFLPDREFFIEEWADIPLSDFLQRVETVGPRAMQARGVERCMAHAVTMRSTFALSHYDDARVFLLDHACQQDGRIAPFFGRPVATGGLRFVLPETNEHPGTLHVTIESFRQSRDEIFVEVKGVFGREQVAAEDLALVADNARAVRAFITDSVFPYLDQFDRAREGQS